MPLPISFADAEYEEMVCCVMEVIVRDDIRPTNPEWIIGKLRDLLRAGLADRQHTIASARAGDILAHEALMREFHEMLDEGAMPPASLRAYAAERDLHPRRGKGAGWWVNFQRDFGISFLVHLTCEAYGIAATRNSASSRKTPCAAAVVADALTRSGRAITEKAVANVCGRRPIWDKLWDKLGLSMLEHTKIIIAELSQRQLKPR
jgi:hypothetical protein